MKAVFFAVVALSLGLNVSNHSQHTRAEAMSKDCVILLHGMGRTRASMWVLSQHLAKAGYATVNYGYPSTRFSIERLAQEHIPAAIAECEAHSGGRIHFVTHSLGGILVRYYLQDSSLPEGSRVVMLSPPNQGSEVADQLKDTKLYQWLTGPPGQQLGTGTDDVPRRLKAVDVEIGIITGQKSLEPWFSRLLPGKDDGKVSVESAKLEEMKEFLVVDSTHAFIMNEDIVLEAVVNFLRAGEFSVPEP